MTVHKFNMWVSGWCLAFSLNALVADRYILATIGFVLSALNFIVGYDYD